MNGPQVQPILFWLEVVVGPSAEISAGVEVGSGI